MSADRENAAERPAAGRGTWARQRLPLLVVAVVVLMAGLGALWYHLEGREKTDDAQVEGHIMPVGARIGGSVAEVLVKDNQVVKAGDVLVRVDPRDYEVALLRARAELADAQAAAAAAATSVPIVETTSVTDVQRAAGSTMSAGAATTGAAGDVDAAKARLQMAKARLVETEANAEKARKDRDRLKGLVAKEEISQQQFDAVVAAASVAEASVESARANVQEADTGVRVAESKLEMSRGMLTQAQASERASRTAPDQVRAARARLDAAEARVAQSKAAVQQAELNLTYATITTPGDGVVSRKNVEPGQVIQPGQSLMAIVSLNDVWVVANFKETQLANIRPGQRVAIDVDAFGHNVEGHVESIAAATGAKFSLLPPENATGNFVKVVQRVPVRIALPTNALDPPLRPGLSVVATVYTR